MNLPKVTKLVNGSLESGSTTPKPILLITTIYCPSFKPVAFPIVHRYPARAVYCCTDLIRSMTSGLSASEAHAFSSLQIAFEEDRL